MSENWSTQQLAEFLALVSSFDDEASALRGAVERAAEVLDADAAALLGSGRVLASTGFPADEVPERRLAAAALEDASVLHLPGVGDCETVALRLGGEPESRLLVARAGEAFTREETTLLRGMGRVLMLTRQMLGVLAEERRLRARSQQQAEENARLLASNRERQMLLERLSRIQQSIMQHADRQEILNAIVAGAQELLGDDVVAIRLLDPADPDRMVVAAALGVGPELLDAIRCAPVGGGAGGRAIKEDRLIVIERYDQSRLALEDFRAERLQAAMAAPVHERGDVVGSLVVASYARGRTFSESEQEVLQAFAEHASLALTHGRTVENAIHQAFHDDLTGLPNRALFLDRLEHSLERAQRTGGRATVLFLDLDSFKNVNDSKGHAAGDQLLIAVAERLSGCLRGVDTVARFGGDEFAILLEDTRNGDGVAVAGRILHALDPPFPVRGSDVYLGASIGITTGGSQSDDLLRDADLAMYKAKGSGKGRFEVFEAGMHAAAVERLQLEGDLQRATERAELLLHYQPLVNLQSGVMIGVEALVRWRHPERGLLAPGAFIPLAEQTRMMMPIGRWVLAEACRQTALWRRCGHQISVAVNLSGTQLLEPGLRDDVREAISGSGLDPAALTLEITETVLMHDIESTVAALEELKALGVRLAIDDFGTGYSSLQYLRRFPVDILKIAKPFVDGLAEPRDEATIVRAIIDLADSFRLDLVAEGIELERQRRRLIDLGCPVGQGYLFARPQPALGIERLLARPDQPAGADREPVRAA